jgi:hypothetical protein
MTKVANANNYRDSAGVGSVINRNHEGTLKRSTESITERRIGNLSSAELNYPKKKETGFANPSFLGGGKEGE